jgi:hypothetical protein
MYDYFIIIVVQLYVFNIRIPYKHIDIAQEMPNVMRERAYGKGPGTRINMPPFIGKGSLARPAVYSGACVGWKGEDSAGQDT